MSDTAHNPPQAVTILSYVGGHDTVIYEGAEYDVSIRRYRGGHPAAVIPFSGRMLSAYAETADTLPPLQYGGTEIPVRSASKWIRVDPIPDKSVCDYALVSSMYVAACQSLGLDTSRLLTIGQSVVDEQGHTVGAVWLTQN